MCFIKWRCSILFKFPPGKLCCKNTKSDSASDITSGSAGDVMIEIPKIGFKITAVGSTVTVKITENPADSNYKYYAHTRVTEGDRGKLYVGAFLGYNLSSKLRSLSGKAPTATQTRATFRTQAQANGTGYDLLSFYPYLLLQCLYLIRYGSLDIKRFPRALWVCCANSARHVIPAVPLRRV